MHRRLTAVTVLTVALLAGGCSFDSPKLKAAPPVTTAPAAGAASVVPGVGPSSTVVGGVTNPGTAVTLPSASVVPADAGCTSTATPPPPTITKVATATAALDFVPVYDQATSPTPCERLPNPDPELHHPPVFIVLAASGDRLQVLLPTRPNQSVGWVTARDVAVAETTFRVEVSLSAHTVKVFKGAASLVSTPAGVGTGDTPTPPGTYFIVGLIKPTNGGYGPYAYALSGHSEKLETFAGGDGRLGLHGTDDPASIGKDVSHGCIRIPNDVITKLAESIGLPLGTPVIVTA